MQPSPAASFPARPRGEMSPNVPKCLTFSHPPLVNPCNLRVSALRHSRSVPALSRPFPSFPWANTRLYGATPSQPVRIERSKGLPKGLGRNMQGSWLVQRFSGKTETGPAPECRACTFGETVACPGLGQAASVSLALWSLEPAGGPDFAAGYLPYLDSAVHIAVFVELDIPARAVVVDVLAIGDQR